MAERVPKLPAKFRSIAVADFASELSIGAGRSITSADVFSVLKAGGPANADGSIDVAPFAAWLVKETPRAP